MHCPDCGKKADAAHSLFILYEYRLDLPIFLCSDCRTIYIDKLTIRQKISEWRNENIFTKKISFRQLYQEFYGELDNAVKNHWTKELGYREVLFSIGIKS